MKNLFLIGCLMLTRLLHCCLMKIKTFSKNMLVSIGIDMKDPLINSRRIFVTIVLVLAVFPGIAQNGKLLSKEPVDLSKTPAWNRITENDTLLPEYAHVAQLTFYRITYRSDSLEVKGILVEPKKEGKYPVVIFNRGGNRKFAPLTIGTMIFYASRLAEQGYVIIGSNYREKDEFGGSEIRDVLCLTETVKEVEKADTNLIGMFGWSRGGMMTYLSLQKSTKIKTAIVGNGPTDMFGIITDRPEMETKVIAECVPGYSANKETELKKRSVVYWADELNKSGSLLILCGTKDDRVNPLQADLLAEKLRAISYDFELKKLDTDHSFSDKEGELSQIVIDWFNKMLKGLD